MLQGAICLDTLSSQWSPVLTIKSALISLQSLLSTPEPKDPQDAEVASMLIRNPAEFEHKAREWAVKYAGAPKKEIAEGSGGATAESITKKRQEAKQQQEKDKLAAYVLFRSECCSSWLTTTQIPRIQQRPRRSICRHGL
jgi:ubiquitin-conjugating enzyme (huntingtin interacting protein 2)